MKRPALLLLALWLACVSTYANSNAPIEKSKLCLPDSFTYSSGRPNSRQRLFNSEELKSVELLLANPPLNIKEFWNWFSKHESEIYSIEKEDDPILKTLKMELYRIDPNLTLELGWTKQGIACIPTGEFTKSKFQSNYLCADIPETRRLLVISCRECKKKQSYVTQLLVANSKVGNFERRHSGLEYVQFGNKWLISIGHHPRVKHALGENEAKFVAVPKNGRVNLVVYCSKNPKSSIKSLVKGLVGENNAQSVLGQVVLSEAEEAPASAKQIENLYEELVRLKPDIKEDSTNKGLLKRQPITLPETWMFQCPYSITRNFEELTSSRY